MGAVAMLTISQAIVRLNPPPTYTDIEAAFAAGGAPAAAQAALQAGYMAASANVARVGMR